MGLEACQIPQIQETEWKIKKKESPPLSPIAVKRTLFLPNDSYHPSTTLRRAKKPQKRARRPGGAKEEATGGIEPPFPGPEPDVITITLCSRFLAGPNQQF